MSAVTHWVHWPRTRGEVVMFIACSIRPERLLGKAGRPDDDGL